MDPEAGILNEVLRVNSHSNWMLIWLIVLTIGFVLTRMAFPRYWTRYRQAMTFSMEEERLLKEKNMNLYQTALFLNGLGSLSIALFLFVSLDNFENVKWPGNTAFDLVLFSLLFLLLTIMKFGSITLLGNILKSQGIADRINHSWLIFHKNFGFFLLFFALLVIYVPAQLTIYVMISGFLSLLIMQIMNYLRWFQILIQERISIFYGILYLCTLEIAPILVLIGVLVV
ncbi:MAG: DUF4271 domain-containing protein [Bacteroidales bacterium]|nr:DUF4271 domain-containing protein [Bacteroidales bacterium]